MQLCLRLVGPASMTLAWLGCCGKLKRTPELLVMLVPLTIQASPVRLLHANLRPAAESRLALVGVLVGLAWSWVRPAPARISAFATTESTMWGQRWPSASVCVEWMKLSMVKLLVQGTGSRSTLFLVRKAHPALRRRPLSWAEEPLRASTILARTQVAWSFLRRLVSVASRWQKRYRRGPMSGLSVRSAAATLVSEWNG